MVSDFDDEWGPFQGADAQKSSASGGGQFGGGSDFFNNAHNVGSSGGDRFSPNNLQSPDVPRNPETGKVLIEMNMTKGKTPAASSSSTTGVPQRRSMMTTMGNSDLLSINSPEDNNRGTNDLDLVFGSATGSYAAPNMDDAAGGYTDVSGGYAAVTSPTLDGGTFWSEQAQPEVEFEDHEKHTITVFYKGEKNTVTWYADGMSKRDIKEAILCACDAIIDGGFVLKEIIRVQAPGITESAKPEEVDLLNAEVEVSPDIAKPETIEITENTDPDSMVVGDDLEWEEFDQLRDGKTYLLVPSKERKDLQNITGDRWRRLKVQIDPLLHVEAQKAVQRMKRGTNLLKHTRYGFPHLRQFQLSEDTMRLHWYSSAKSKSDSVVHLSAVKEIRLGQDTPSFKNYRLPMLEHLSFSVITNDGRTLDVTTKDEFEFDHWVIGLKALVYHHTNRTLNKEELLNHSQRFKKALAKNNVSIKLTTLPEVKDKNQVGLDDCIEIQTHKPEEIEQKLDRLKERLKTLQIQFSKLDFHAEAEMEIDIAVLSGTGPAYASIFTEESQCQDEELEMKRVNELIDQVQSALQRARNESLNLKNRIASQAASSGVSSSKEANASDRPNPRADKDGKLPDKDPATAAESKKKNDKKQQQEICKGLDQLLWKAEVDLENIEDILSRYLDNQKDTATPLSVLVQEQTAKLQKQVDEGWEMVSGSVSALQKWWKKS